MIESVFNKCAQRFIQSAIKKEILFAIDSRSKCETVRFSCISYNHEYALNGETPYMDYRSFLEELGVKVDNHGLLVHKCAGRYSLFIMEDIGIRLCNRGFSLPDNWTSEIIGNQNTL